MEKALVTVIHGKLYSSLTKRQFTIVENQIPVIKKHLADNSRKVLTYTLTLNF